MDFTTIRLSRLTVKADISSIKRARYSMQVTSCVLYSKLTEAAQAMGSTKSPYEWLSDGKLKMILDFQIKFHMFIRSIREEHFDLYIESLRALIIWCFIMDKYNYSRWLIVHIFQLITTHVKHSKVQYIKTLRKGFFSFQKSNKKFSRIALDQVHHQNNNVIKATGGATDLVNKHHWFVGKHAVLTFP